MKTTRLTTTLFGSLAAIVLLASSSLRRPSRRRQPTSWRTSATAKWGPAPPMLPPGAQIAVLAGDPTQGGAYTVRLKFPANYDIPAHSHPTDENVVVVSGELFMGMGDKLDEGRTCGLGVGGFALMPANANHFAYTKGETTILLYGRARSSSSTSTRRTIRARRRASGRVAATDDLSDASADVRAGASRRRVAGNRRGAGEVRRPRGWRPTW